MFRLFATLTLFACPAFSFAINIADLKQSQRPLNIIEVSEYLQSDSASETLQQVTTPPVLGQFTPVHNDRLRYNQLLGPTWLKFDIGNPTLKPQQLFIEINAPFLKSAELYYNLEDPGGLERVVTGQNLAYQTRPFPIGNLILPILVETGQQTLLLKLDPIMPTNVDMQLLDENSLINSARKNIQVQTLVIVALISLIVFSLIDLVRFRSPQSVWAAAITAGFALSVAGWSGSVAWLFYNLPWIEVVSINTGTFLSLACLARYLVSIRTDAAPKHWLADSVIWLAYILSAFVILSCLPFSSSLLPLQIIFIPVSFVIFTAYFAHQTAHIHYELPLAAALVLITIYFLLILFVLVGLLSGFGLFTIALNFIALLVSSLMTFTAWKLSAANSRQVAANNLGIEDVHWPLLRKLNHDIRGPINGVLGMAELLQDTTLSAHQHEYVNTVQTAGFALLREADQLQNLIRIGLEKLPEKESEFDLYDLMEDTLHPFSRVAQNKHLELILDIHPNLPTTYLGNEHVIGQIISIILDNALKYTERGEVIVQVRRAPSNYIQFNIIDTGPGISKELREHLFKFPNHRKRSHKPKEMHLGLPVVKYLTTQLKGQVSVSSELRIGTKFTVELPLKIVSSHTVKSETVPPVPLNELRIMVLDDNLTCRKMIEHVALSWGASVVSMSNAQSAMANLHNQFHKAEPIDVLVLDQNMPTITGIELSERIRQDASLNSDIVIIMMTGVDDLTSDFKGSDSGVQYMLSKPVSARALKQTIAHAMPVIQANRGKNHGKKSYFF